jgi:hypothetical protein
MLGCEVSERTISRWFATPIDSNEVRRIMRMVVLASFVRVPGSTDIGWCYWTPGVYDLWKQGRAAFSNFISARKFSPLAASPFGQMPAPASATIEPEQLKILSSLYSIEDDFVAGLAALDSMVHQSENFPGLAMR